MILMVNNVSHFAPLFFLFSVVQLLGQSILPLLKELYTAWVKSLLLYDLPDFLEIVLFEIILCQLLIVVHQH